MKISYAVVVESADTLLWGGSEETRGGSSPPDRTNKNRTFVYRQMFGFCLFKPQAWHIIAARSAVYIIKGGEPPLHLITRQRASTCGLMIYKTSFWWYTATSCRWYTRLRRDWDARLRKVIELPCKIWYNTLKGSDCMAKNYLLIYSEQLATDIELLCQNIKVPSNTLFQIRKSSSSVYANIREANWTE